MTVPHRNVERAPGMAVILVRIVPVVALATVGPSVLPNVQTELAVLSGAMLGFLVGLALQFVLFSFLRKK